MLRIGFVAALLNILIVLNGCSGSSAATAAPEAAPEAAEESTTAPASPGSELIEAVVAGDLAQTKALVEAGADVNSSDEHGFRVLVNAMANYNVGIVDYLVRKGAQTGLEKPDPDPDKKRLFGQGLGQNELLLVAAESGDLNSVKRLIAAGANINAQDESGFTVLVNAIAGYHTEVVKYLVSQGATIVANP